MDRRAFETRRWSKDAALIPKMLAFLQATSDIVEIRWDEEPIELADGSMRPVGWEAWRGPSSKPQHGNTLSEALAKLVVAVGEAQRRVE